MGFGSLIHRSITGEVRKQDQVRVEDYLFKDSKIIMNSDGTCDVVGTVLVDDIGLKSLNQLTPKINTISGSFICGSNQLTSLEGSPQKVMGSFKCYDNQLTSLKGCPEYVGATFDCSENELESLEHISKYIGRVLICNYNKKKFTNSDIPQGVKIKSVVF